jgi:hypothetical protein
MGSLLDGHEPRYGHIGTVSRLKCTFARDIDLLQALGLERDEVVVKI